MAPGTEFARDFCAGIGPLQPGHVLVSFDFKAQVKYNSNYKSILIMFKVLICVDAYTHMRVGPILDEGNIPETLKGCPLDLGT